jgi:hypothetical protein
MEKIAPLPVPDKTSDFESCLSCNKARVFLAQLKGVKKIDHATLGRLVLQEGLPAHLDPFGTGNWCFLESEILAWFHARLAGPVKPLRGPGRPRLKRCING